MRLYLFLILYPFPVCPASSTLTAGRVAVSRGDFLSAEPLLRAGVADAPSGAPRAAALEELADVLSTLRRHADASTTRTEALRVRLAASGGETTVTDLVVAHASIARDLQAARKYDEALRLLARARAAAAPSGGLSPPADAILLRLESSVHDCLGDDARALAMLDAALGNRDDALERDDALTLLDLVRKAARRAASGSEGVSASATALFARAHALEQGLLRRGPYEHAAQLPQSYVKGLKAAPWHVHSGAAAPWRALTEPVAAALTAAAPALLADYDALRASGAMLAETECVHVGRGEGSWSWYATNGFWAPRDASGCAIATPAACELLARLARDVPSLRVLRGGFSAISGKAHLRPHHGISNAQLKFHLALRIPTRASGGSGSARRRRVPCAHLTVGNETRPWEHVGHVLLFDDSWEHSVQHDCNAERVVFQLVIAHPEFGVGPEPARAHPTTSRTEL